MKAIFKSIAAVFVGIFMFLFGWAMPKRPEPPIHPDAGYYFDLFEADKGFEVLTYSGILDQDGFDDIALFMYYVEHSRISCIDAEVDAINAITEKHFGRTIDPQRLEELKQWGWGAGEVNVVLVGELIENPDGSLTGDYKRYMIGDGDDGDKLYENRRENLLAGKDKKYPKPDLLRVTFEVREDDEGEYLFYHSVERV